MLKFFISVLFCLSENVSCDLRGVSLRMMMMMMMMMMMIKNNIK